MPRTHYCHPVDVVRRFHPGIAYADLKTNEYLPTDGLEIVTNRIEGVESAFETDTGTALREVRVGSQGHPATYEHLEAKRTFQFPTKYTLDHRNVLPIDSSQGDAIEVRTARDNWTDITGDEGSRWVLVDNRQGKLEFYSRLRHTIQFRVRPGVRFIRLTYRYGSLGGSPTEGGQTTLGAALNEGQTPNSLSVTNAARLPNGGGLMLINPGAVDDAEYVRVSSVDAANDTINVAGRGLRRTQDSDHSSGDVIHYCPMRVREAIAAKTAAELLGYDAFVDRILDTDEGVDPTRRLDDWEREYERVVARYSQWHYG